MTGRRFSNILVFPEQKAYELLRTVVLFGETAAERAKETEASERTLHHKANQFDQHGMGWSLFLDVSQFGFDSTTASRHLLARGKIAATPMVNWGSANSDKYVRLVFANEPVHRLRGVVKRVQQALT
jgi:aspartate/methionine/tyrosine aminotransferase